MIELFIILAALALIMEIVDSSLGMMYGTILSHVLIGFGFDPLIVVPSILISQAIGGIAGTIFHNKLKNADFNGLTRDTKIVLAVVAPGLVGVLIGTLVAISLPKLFMQTYIGILVVLMGILCIFPVRYAFRWWKMYAIGLLSSFNKFVTGGGFGPITSTGKIVGGLKSKVSVATTTYAEVPICIVSFIIYMISKGLSDPFFTISLCAGAFIGGIMGPFVTSRFNQNKLRKAVGILAIIAGVWVLLKIVLNLNISGGI
ncbi:MAG: sulfite exporter TauE/SafE family protein [Candidatus Aenigmatarchaeota archaeon]